MVYQQERILRERFAQVTCAACGSCHRPDDMLVLAQRTSRWLVLLTCWQCQRRSIFVASFPQPRPAHNSFDYSALLDDLFDNPVIFEDSLNELHAEDFPGLIQPFPADSPDRNTPLDSLPDAAVTSDDVEGMRHFLEGFNGDFGALFGPPEGHSRG